MELWAEKGIMQGTCSKHHHEHQQHKSGLCVGGVGRSPRVGQAVKTTLWLASVVFDTGFAEADEVRSLLARAAVSTGLAGAESGSIACLRLGHPRFRS